MDRRQGYEIRQRLRSDEHIFGVRGGHDIDRDLRLPEYEFLVDEDERAEETIQGEKIEKSVSEWISNIKEWTYDKLITKIINTDLNNLEELCRIMNFYKYSLVLDLGVSITKREISSLPEVYHKIIDHYYDKNNQVIGLEELLTMEQNNPEWYEYENRASFSLSTGRVLNIEEEHYMHFLSALRDRQQIERYFTLNRFGPNARDYVVTRLF